MTDREKIYNLIFEKVNRQCKLLGIDSPPITSDLDLVREGIFDSLSFIDLIADCENEFNISVDLEKYNPSEFTRFTKLIEIIESSIES